MLDMLDLISFGKDDLQANVIFFNVQQDFRNFARILINVRICSRVIKYLQNESPVKLASKDKST